MVRGRCGKTESPIVKLYRWRDRPNFGDVLNDVLWPDYFGPFLREDDDTTFAAIGTVLSPALGKSGPVIVFGSGCGYDPLPNLGAHWRFYFVRGPLSAKLLGLDQRLAITDPAILLADRRPKVEPGRTVSFIPHWESSLSPLWREACRLAGIQYIDPLAPVPEICDQLARSSTVIAEAMHGAIVADAFRVPWIPALTSSRFNLFKWQDWGSSLGVSPSFHALPQIGIADMLRMLLVDPDDNAAFIAAAGAARDSGVEQTFRFKRVNRLYARLLRKPSRSWLEYKLLERLGPDLDHAVARVSPGLWSRRLERAAEALRSVSQQPAFLSSDVRFASALARVHEKVRELQNDLVEKEWGPQSRSLRAARC
jgi:succinoglycan biosynthesis protein ExoV